jgi:hypothetical protein
MNPDFVLTKEQKLERFKRKLKTKVSGAAKGSVMLRQEPIQYRAEIGTSVDELRRSIAHFDARQQPRNFIQRVARSEEKLHFLRQREQIILNADGPNHIPIQNEIFQDFSRKIAEREVSHQNSYEKTSSGSFRSQSTTSNMQNYEDQIKPGFKPRVVQQKVFLQQKDYRQQNIYPQKQQDNHDLLRQDFQNRPFCQLFAETDRRYLPHQHHQQRLASKQPRETHLNLTRQQSLQFSPTVLLPSAEPPVIVQHCQPIYQNVYFLVNDDYLQQKQQQKQRQQQQRQQQQQQQQQKQQQQQQQEYEQKVIDFKCRQDRINQKQFCQTLGPSRFIRDPLLQQEHQRNQQQEQQPQQMLKHQQELNQQKQQQQQQQQEHQTFACRDELSRNQMTLDRLGSIPFSENAQAHYSLPINYETNFDQNVLDCNFKSGQEMPPQLKFALKRSQSFVERGSKDENRCSLPISSRKRIKTEPLRGDENCLKQDFLEKSEETKPRYKDEVAWPPYLRDSVEGIVRSFEETFAKVVETRDRILNGERQSFAPNDVIPHLLQVANQFQTFALSQRYNYLVENEFQNSLNVKYDDGNTNISLSF